MMCIILDVKNIVTEHLKHLFIDVTQFVPSLLTLMVRWLNGYMVALRITEPYSHTTISRKAELGTA